MSPTEGLDGWAPFGIRRAADGAAVDWCDLGGERLAEPFFDQTVQRRLREGAPRRTTPLSALAAAPELAARPAPAGFVFHVSRCGSTLVTQMLAAVPRFAALSEPAIVEEVLRLPEDDATRIASLRAIVRALAPRGTVPVVKAASRSAAAIPLFEAAFPGTRWIFLARDPAEVVTALVGSRTERLPPGLAGSGLLEGGEAEQARMRPAEFWARVVGARCAAALAALRSGRGRAVDYEELPEALFTRVLPWFGLALAGGEEGAMRAASRRDAKDPSRPFVPDAAARREAASPEIRDAVARHAAEAYAALARFRAPRGFSAAC